MMLDAGALLSELVSALERDPGLRDRLRRAFDVAPDPEPLYLAPGQFAARLGVSRRTVFAWLSAGLPSVGRGRARRVNVAAADAWLAARARTDDAIERRARRDAQRAARRAIAT